MVQKNASYKSNVGLIAIYGKSYKKTQGRVIVNPNV
jgi:hypothetical protein